MKTKIIFEDSELFVVYKPAGLATETSGSFAMDVISELKNYLRQPNPYVGMIHRLDQPVEGLLVFAKTKACASALSKQLQENQLKKSYIAVVSFSENKRQEVKSLLDSAEVISLNDYLVKDAKNSIAKIVGESDADAKLAKLCFQVDSLSTDLPIAKVRVEIETGRFHQIRCQMSHHDMPLLGDQKYGSELSQSISTEQNVRHVALCANKLSLIHPKTKEKMSFSIEPKNKAFSLL